MNFFGPLKTVLWDYFLKPIFNAIWKRISIAIVGEMVDEAIEKKVAEKIGPLTAAELTLPAVVPHGLRSFDGQDASFFLNLLPGPHRDDGLPESLHFWKTRIEETDADKTFSVGLIYGPSGCGKTSLMKAGLIPKLAADHVTTLYVEATPSETEKRILVALRKHCPELEAKSSIRAALRRKENIPKGNKVLLILDQFEQYLQHARTSDEQKDLIDALRECDGEQLQCILMVREDFIRPVTVFINRLNIRLSQDENYALVNLFDKRHAKKVLALFGQASDRLPNLYRPDR